jgi:hypothetical protein
MRQARLVVLPLALVSLLSLAAVDDARASASPTPPTIQPRITAVSSTAICNIVPCTVTVILSYNGPVGFTSDAYRAFTVTDLSQPSPVPCVSLRLTPSPVVGLESQLLLHVSCLVAPGDQMHLAYVGFYPPVVSPGYVYSLALPHGPALSPQLFD